MNVYYYKGLSKYYFKSIISNIIKIGKLKETTKTILDFGCGSKILSMELKNKKVLNYDLDPKYSEHCDYKNLFFDIVIFNHVFMYMSEKEIMLTLENIKKINKNCEIIVGIGKGGLLNKLAAIASFNFTAHKGTLTNYEQQLVILKKEMKILKEKKNIFFMTDVYYLSFKE
jgi:hypothetical protein